MIFEVGVAGSDSQQQILSRYVCSKGSLEATRNNTNPDHHHFGVDFHIFVNIIFQYAFCHKYEKYLK